MVTRDEPWDNASISLFNKENLLMLLALTGDVGTGSPTEWGNRLLDEVNLLLSPEDRGCGNWQSHRVGEQPAR